jgi:hypothetical protein
MKLLQNVTKQTWKTLDTLQENGWDPLINKLPNAWHCNLTHRCAPVPLMELRDHMWHHTNRSPYQVHGYGQTPQDAIDVAIKQVHNLLTPAGNKP